MKPKSTLRSFLAIAGSSLLAISYSHAANLTWDITPGTVGAGDNAITGGGGTWDTTLGNWTTDGGANNIAWSGATNTAIFGGTAGTVAANTAISVGGLQFNTTSYILASDDGLKTLSFATGDNTILFNNIAAASTSAGAAAGLKLGGAGNVILSAANPTTAGTLTLSYSVASNTSNGWSGTTTINPGMTLALAGRDLSLSSTTGGITLNGGGILLTNTTPAQAAFNRVNDSAAIVSNGGLITVTNSGATTYLEDMGALDLRRGQLNVTQTNSSGTQTLTFGNGSLSTVNGVARTNATTSAINFSGASLGSAGNSIKITSQGDTLQNEIIAPWATYGGAANTQTDYAVYNRAGSANASTNTLGIQGAAITATDQSLWSTTHAATSNYTLTNATTSAANGLLGGTRSVNTLRSTTARSTVASIASNVITITGSTFQDNDVMVNTSTAGPTGLTRESAYYVVNASGATFQLAATPGGTPITGLSGTGFLTSGITLSSGKNLETYGLLGTNSTANLVIGRGTAGGEVTTPTGGGNLYLTTGGGGIVIDAPITNATGGGAVTVVKSGSTGTLTLSGNNTFTGGLVVNAGGANNNVRLVGTQNFTGGITLNGGGIGDNSANGTLTTLAATLNGNAITVNGPAHLVVEGTLGASSTIAINSNAVLKLGAGNSALTVQGVVSGSGVLDVNANNFNAGYSVSLTNTANTFTGDVIYSASNGSNTLSVSSIGDAGKVVVGHAVNSAVKTFALNSAATVPLTFNTRQFELTGSAGAIPLVIANNSVQAFNINTDLLVSSAQGTRTLTLQGTGAGLGTFAGKLANGSLTSLGLTKADSASTWTLTNTANSYTGRTTITAGTLQVATLANGGSNSNIGASTSAVGNLVLNGGTLRYTGGLVSTDRNFALTASSSIDASGTGAVSFSQTGIVSPDQILTGDVAVSKVVTNLSSTADLVVGMRVTGTGIAANSTIASIDSNTQITLNNTPTAGTGVSLSFGYTASARTLTLTGTNTGANTIAGILQNTTAVTTGVLSLTKSSTGTWVLSNANTYTGTTTAGGGILKLNNATALPGGIGATGGTSGLTINGGGIVGLTADFSRGLGTGVTQIQFLTGGGGFAAYGGDRTVNLGGAGATGTWNSGSFVPGSTPLILSAADADGTLIFANPINFAGSQRAVQVNNGSAAVDGRLSGVLSGGTTSGLNKTGTGTLEITNSSNSYSGATAVSDGTLRLGANDVLPNTTNVTIAAATLAVGAGVTDTVGTLDVTAAATINLGDASSKLVLANSNLVDWTDTDPDGTLNITGAFVSGASIKFTTSGGLTAGQLASITLNGSPASFSLDGSGFLVSGGGPVGFAAWQAANSTAGARGDDHDNDGVDNGTEHFLGGTANTTGFTPLPGVTNTLGALSVTWAKAATYSGTYGTDFVVETSTTLVGAWTPEILSPNPNFTVVISGNNVIYTFPNPLGTKKFARLKVTGP